MDSTRFEKQIRFMLEIDKLKSIVRQTLITDGTRQEDSAEHSWHLALMAVILAEYAKEEIDLFRTLKMILVHDLVEIDAGDTYCYDEDGNAGKAERELKAADRIFDLLPEDQAEEVRRLWDEFEEKKTPESRFAGALDRLQPLLNNYKTGGRMWVEHGVRIDQVLLRNRPIEDGAPDLWKFASGLIDDALGKGLLKKAKDD